MTGLEQDREAVFQRIVELEKQTEEYRDSTRKKKDMEQRRPTLRRCAKRLWRKLPEEMRHSIKRALPNKTTPQVHPVENDLMLDTQSAEERRPLYVRKERIAVYTALFGPVDTIQEPMFQPDNIDYFLLTDQEVPEGSLWQQLDIAVIPEGFRDDPVLSNRWCKMHPHILFPEYDYSVYIDANIRVFSDMTPVTAGLDRFPLAMFRHKRRDCVYEEIQACTAQGKGSPVELEEHRKLIRSHGIPKHWGLLEASIIARKHNDPQCADLMDAWWRAFLQNSKRDQISLIDCLWLAEIEPSQVGTLGANLQKCDLFFQMRHVGDER